jgi:hypothetical protein
MDGCWGRLFIGGKDPVMILMAMMNTALYSATLVHAFVYEAMFGATDGNAFMW